QRRHAIQQSQARDALRWYLRHRDDAARAGAEAAGTAASGDVDRDAARAWRAWAGLRRIRSLISPGGSILDPPPHLVQRSAPGKPRPGDAHHSVPHVRVAAAVLDLDADRLRPEESGRPDLLLWQPIHAGRSPGGAMAAGEATGAADGIGRQSKAATVRVDHHLAA